MELFLLDQKKLSHFFFSGEEKSVAPTCQVCQISQSRTLTINYDIPFLTLATKNVLTINSVSLKTVTQLKRAFCILTTAKNSFVTFSNSYRVEVSSPSYYAHDQAIGVLVKHFYNSNHIPLLTTWPYLPKGNVTHTELYDTKYCSLFITTSDNPLEDSSQIEKNKYPFLYYNSGHFFSPTYKLANVLFQILLN